MAEKNISVDIWKNWEKTGRSEFFKLCKQMIKNEDKSPVFSKTDKLSGLSRYIYELISHGIRGPLKKEMVVTAIAELKVLHSDIPAILLDILSAIDAESFNETQNEERNNFAFIVKESEKYFSDKLVKERLEIDTLQDVGILKNKHFYTRFIRVKTKLYYKQRKFNLFREESEGYAKLSVELNQERIGSKTSRKVLEIIKSLIGCFNLDPNRVLDVILESFETRPEHYDFFIPLLKSYMSDAKTICEVLGFKFSKYQSELEDSNITPKSLYKLTALLLQHGIIALDDIYCWLIPDDKTMAKDWDKEMKDAKEYFRKLQIISIKEKDETLEEKETVQDKYSLNQKFGLCQALLEIGDWNNAQLLIKKMPDHMAMEQPEIAKTLCNLLHSILEPIYRTNCRLAPKISGRLVPLLVSSLSPKPVQTFLEMRDVAISMLVTLGPSLHHDATLMYKIIRISKAALADCEHRKPTSSNDNLYYDILSILDSAILPSLSYMDCNCCIAEEIWNILKLYPYQYRYCLYGRWKNDTHQQYPNLLRKRGDAQKKIKNIMKRVSKETIKPVGRHIGKLTHSSPGFLFDYVLLQIQIYDNLINPVVDSLKYLTSLSYDVLGYCLIEALAQVHKDRFKDDSTSISSWLQSLASFCGAIFKKYNIELSGLLQFVANQLKAQKSLDLLILKEIVQKMAGIEAAEELTPEQVEAMAGGEILKGEAGQFSQIRNTKKSSQRLKEAMAEQNLAVTLCLLIAQQKDCVVYRETDNSPLKLVGKLYDQCQDTLVQFGTFLGSTMSVDEYVERLPTIQSMLQDYHIHMDVAFFLARPMFTHAINIKYDQLRKSDPNCKKLSTSVKQQKYYEAVAEVMAPVIISVQPLHPLKVWEDISPQFLVTFWSLTMFDLYVPVESYQREINKLKQLSQQVMDSKDMAGGKGKKEQERYLALMEKLQDEKKKQQEHVEKVLYRLKQEKDIWFLSRAVKSAKNETITQFLQLCLFPRCIFTAVDAVYCAKFVHTIHMLKTANFSTLLCYDRLFCDITYSVTSCTENEANRYGRFLCAMLETVMKWHSEESIFKAECADYPGFVTKFRVSNQFSEACDHVGYENYRHVCHKWHYKMAKAIIICLESKDYVQIRNSLIILIKILPHFPVLSKLSGFLEKKIEKVREEEKGQRQDLFILATSYIGQLKAKSSSMMKEADFHQVADKPPKKIEEPITTDQIEHSRISNGEMKGDKTGDKIKENNFKDRNERKSVRRVISPSSLMQQSKISDKPHSDDLMHPPSKEKPLKEKICKDKDFDPRDKQLRKEERREELEREKEKRRERKEEKLAHKEERQYRDERYEMISPKEDDNARYGPGSMEDPYYYVMSTNGSNIPTTGSTHRRSQENIEPESRDVKRRKLEGNSSKSSKHEDRRGGSSSSGSHTLPPGGEYTSSPGIDRSERTEKKDRSSKSKREKQTEEEKELRRERKLGRKRDRAEEVMLQAEQKRRKEEEKAAAKLAAHQNGDMESPHLREKHHHGRSQEKSPYTRERERSHDRVDPPRDKHRRSSEAKRR